MTTSRNDKLSKVLTELREEYLQKFPQKLKRLRAVTQTRDWQQIEDEYHKLKGTGKTYGFPEISTICEILETAAQQPALRNPELFEQALTLLEKLHEGYISNKPLSLADNEIARRLLALKVK